MPFDDNGFIQHSVATPAGKMICLDTLDNSKRGGFLFGMFVALQGKGSSFIFRAFASSGFLQLAGFSYSGPNSLVHPTPFDFENRKVTAFSPEPPVYHKVLLYSDRVVVHARDFLHSEPRIVKGSCTEYPKP